MRYVIVAFVISCVAYSAFGDEIDSRLQNIVAMEKIRSAVAPLCGKGIHFDCPIAVEWKPRHCAMEYLVILPQQRAGPAGREIWIGLNHNSRIVSVEPKRELLCTNA